MQDIRKAAYVTRCLGAGGLAARGRQNHIEQHTALCVELDPKLSPLWSHCLAALQEDWLEKAGTIIQSRIERYAQSEIRFNLMAVIRDRRDVLQEQLDALQARQAPSGNPGADKRHGSATGKNVKFRWTE